MVEGHPIANVFENEKNTKDLKVIYSYFHKSQPVKYEPEGSYADRSAEVLTPTYEWTHSLGDVFNALVSVGLRIEFLHEFPYCSWSLFPFMEKGKDGWWRLKDRTDTLPLLFSVKAIK